MIRSTETDEIMVLKQHLQTLKERVSSARKQGMDTKIAEIQLMNISPKIMMASATNNHKDIESVQRLLSEIETELKQLRKEDNVGEVLKRAAEEEKELLAKKETVKFVNLNQEEIIEKTNNLIKQANGYLDSGQFEKVFPIYLELQGIYRYLPKDLKEQVYHEAMSIYSRLRQSGIFKAKTRWERFVARIARRFGK